MTQDSALAVQAVSPMGLLQLAIEREGSIDVIERLAKLQMEMMDRDARLAYIAAFEEFKRNAPTIVKDSAIMVKEEVRGRYAKLDQICNKLIPALLAVGITHRWKTTEGDGGRIICTCYLRHRQGHEEQGSTFGAPPDTSGSKNAAQAVGSTGAYLERYTLVASCGIAIQGLDSVDSGRADKNAMPDETVQEWIDAMNQADDHAGLRKVFADAYNATQKLGDTRAEGIITTAKNKRKEALR